MPKYDKSGMKKSMMAAAGGNGKKRSRGKVRTPTDNPKPYTKKRG